MVIVERPTVSGRESDVLLAQRGEVRRLRQQLNERNEELLQARHELAQLQQRYSRLRYRLVERAAAWLQRRPLLHSTARRLALRLSSCYGVLRRQDVRNDAAAIAVPEPACALTKDQARRLLAGAARKPLVSIVVPVYRIAPKWLDKCIQSVLRQDYENWELILVDDGSRDARLTELMQTHAAGDRRIRLAPLETNRGISLASNAGIEAATGQFIGFLDHDDELSRDALTWIVMAHNRAPEAVWFYSDEDMMDTEGRVLNASFKPDFSPEYLLSAMYLCHFSVYSAELLRRAGGLRQGFEGAQDHDLALRLSEQVTPDRVVHIPRILYHWRQLPSSTSASMASKPYAPNAGRVAVREALKRRGLAGEVESYPLCPTLYQVKLQPRQFPRVSVVIPTKNGLADLKACLASLRRHTRYPNYEVVVIDNQSDDPALLAYLEQQQSAGSVQVIRFPHPFNHSAMNNLAVEQTSSEFVVFLNNDVEISSDQWLEMMVATAAIDPAIAGVGTKLLYPDGTIQHAGLIMGLNGVASSAHRHVPSDSLSYCCRAHALQDLSGATAAFLLMRRSAFLSVGGFDAKRYPTSFNDVDLWLKLRRAGFRCLYNPLVQGVHYESKSRGIDVEADAVYRQRLKADWGDQLLRDPFYNPNLALDNEQFRGVRPYPVEWDFPELSSQGDETLAESVAVH
jgi:glycosyltransferase involved in cell wall biosynthesis